MGDWKQQLERQGRRLAQLEKELNTSNQARRQLLADQEAQQRELAAARAELAAQTTQRDAMEEKIRVVEGERDDAVTRAEPLGEPAANGTRRIMVGRRVVIRISTAERVVVWS